MTIGQKFSITCATLVAFTVGLAAVSLVNIAGLADSVHRLQTDPIPGQYSIGKIASAVRDLRGIMKDVLLEYAVNAGKDAPRLDKRLTEAQKRFRDEVAAYDKTISQAVDRENFDEFSRRYDRYMQSWTRVQSMLAQGELKEIVAIFQAETMPAFDEMQKMSDTLVDWNQTFAVTLAEEAAAKARTAKVWNWTVSLLALGCGASLAFFITRNVNGSLRVIVKDLSTGAEQTASAAGHVSSASQSLAQGSCEQATSLEETSASSEEINSMARRNAESSRSAADLVGRSQQKIIETNQALDEMVTAMGEISASSEKISKIIKVIDDIAFQTNLLALNASVEAARAGESGMGFAVVADEVRGLARRCAEAAKDTSALIEESMAKSNGGKSKVDQVATAIRGITADSARVKALVEEVNVGSEEQARGIDQIGKAIIQMQRVTESTAASAEENASAAEELNAQSAALHEAVRRLTAMTEGASSTRRSSPDAQSENDKDLASAGRV